jgi:predicted nucleic acid-binding Zn ribbon protein
VGLVFRGSGFYTTDYRRSKDGASRSEGEGKKETKEQPAKESKPAD